LSSKNPNSVSLVILALNEEEGLENTYNTFKNIFINLEIDHEIFIINDGSSDKTGEIAKNLERKDHLVTVFHNTKPMGMGYGYKQGLKKASKEYYMWTGAYDNLKPEDIISFLNGMGQFDCVAGYITNTEIRSLSRRILSALFTLVMNLLTGLNLKYYNGMDLARTKYLKLINIESNGYTWLAECIVKLVLMRNHTCKHIPLILKDRGESQSNAFKPKIFLNVVKFLIFSAYEIISFRLKKKLTR
jgi:glycosyltransferase involved in cell wall biosynthesis